MIEKHGTVQKPAKKKIECKICMKTFHRPNKLMRHMEIIHLQKVEMSFETSCDRCNETFPSSRDLNIHLFQAHIEEAISC